jgi:hypothetical protein
MQSADKQINITGVSTVSFTDSFRKFYGRYNDLVCQYIPLRQMLSGVFHTDR